MNTQKKISVIFLFYLSAYTLVNLATLTRFPFIHSDEPWLAGLSASYLKSGTAFVTEPFFDLMPRQPHMIKSLFHGLQACFLAVFGQGIFSVRLLSLVAAVAALVLMHRLVQRRIIVPAVALLVTVLFSVNIQFVYAAHFARQEILLLCVLLASLLLYEGGDSPKARGLTLAAALIGLSIGLHPNAFILAMMLGAAIGWDVLRGTVKPALLLRYGLILGGFAIVYIALSLVGNPNFFADYLAFGRSLSVDESASGRLLGLGGFYTKLLLQISGTYYLPDLRFFALASLAAMTAGVFLLSRSPKGRASAGEDLMGRSLMLVLGFNLGILIIGRYNPTAILFVLPPVYLLFSSLLARAIRHPRLLLSLLMTAVLLAALQTGMAIRTAMGSDYQTYQETIARHLPPNAVVLGNLSSGFAFANVPFYDIRNLGYLNGMTVSRYIQERGINTIVYYEEYDYIHRNPQWQILYGDDSSYYAELNALIKKNGTLLHHFESPYYGTRLIRYMGDYPWEIRIYRLNE